MSSDSQSDTEKLLNAEKIPADLVDKNEGKPRLKRSAIPSRLLEVRSRSASAPPHRQPDRDSGATTEDIWGATGYVVLSSVAAALGGLLFGYDVGIVSGAILQLRKPDVFNLSCLLQELVVSSMLLGAMVGSICGGFLVDRFGRRVTIIINAGIFIVGALVLALAPSYPLLIVGRLVVGFGVSVSAIGECIYISEIAPPTKRGLLVSLNELGITLGVLLAYLINYFFINHEDGWRYMFGLSVLPAAVQGTAMIFLPKSPRYLMLSQKEAEAEKVLKMLRRKQDVSLELTNIRLAIMSEKNRTFCELFGKKVNMRGRMLIGAGLVFFQQATGQPNVLYYAPTIFKAVGFHSDVAATLATVGVGAVKVMATVVSLMCVDRVGRRTLLLLGASAMAVGTLTLGVLTDVDMDQGQMNACRDMNSSSVNSTSQMLTDYLYNTSDYLHQGKNFTSLDTTSGLGHGSMQTYINHRSLGQHENLQSNDWFLNLSYPNSTSQHGHTASTSKQMSTAARYASLAALMLFCGAYGISFGPVTWLILSEIYPATVKGRAIALATVLNWGTNLVISLTFLNLMNLLTVCGTFLMYSGICVVAVLFIATFLPETKNRSLEQISEDFKNSSLMGKITLTWGKLRCCRGRRVSVAASQYMQVPLTEMDPGVT